jgi:hypothetical protein
MGTLSLAAIAFLAAAAAAPDPCPVSFAVATGSALNGRLEVSRLVSTALLGLGFNMVDPPNAAQVLLEADPMIPDVLFEADKPGAQPKEVHCTVGVRVARGMDLSTHISVEGRTCAQSAAALAKALAQLIKPVAQCRSGSAT